MATSHRLLVLIVILTFLPALATAQTDKPGPKLLDGELIEAGQPAPAPPAAQLAPENNTSQTVAVRQEFAVTLPSNPSTGFGWKVASYPKFTKRPLFN